MGAANDYDVVVIGGGAAGLSAAGTTAFLGAKTLLVERHRLGGDCTWTGCIPSKALLKAAQVAHHARTASRWGLPDTPMEVDFRAVMARVHRIREQVYDHADSPERMAVYGVETTIGEATIVDRRTVRVDDRELRCRFIVVATGSVATLPDIPGLAAVAPLTNETVFELDELPRRLVVIGGGPVGCELAQAFARLGSRVTLLQRGPRLLPRDDPEASEVLAEALRREGVDVRVESEATGCERTSEGIAVAVGGEVHRGDEVLVAAGRTPRVEGLGLERIGLPADRAIAVDRRGRTRVGNVYAVGDVTEGPRLAHAAEQMGKTAGLRIVLKWAPGVERATMPWVTFTEPEVAKVGLSYDDAVVRYGRVETWRFPYSAGDRPQADDETTGYVKAFCRRGRVVGASVVGARAGDIAAEWALVARQRMSLATLASIVHAYPTYARLNRRVADQLAFASRPLRLLRALRWLLGFRGEVRALPPGEVF